MERKWESHSIFQHRGGCKIGDYCRKDIDVGVDRSQEDIDEWMKRDPIQRMYLGMLDASILNSSDFKDIYKEISNEIEIAWNKALGDPYPTEDKLLSRVYCSEN